MPRKRKTAKQSGTTNEPGPDPPPFTVNTPKPKTRSAQEERATSGKRSDGPTLEDQERFKSWTERIVDVRLFERDIGASSNGRKPDAKPKDKVNTEKTSENRAPIERNPHSVSSTVVPTYSLPKPPSWETVVSRSDEERNAWADKILEEIMSDKANRADPPLLPPTTANFGPENPEKDVVQSFKDFEEEETKKAINRASTNRAVRAAQAAQDKQIKIQDLKNFSKKFTLPTTVPKDLLPILAKDRLKQDHIVAKTKLATNIPEAAKPSNEENGSDRLQDNDLVASMETKGAAQASEDKQLGVQNSKDFSNSDPDTPYSRPQSTSAKKLLDSILAKTKLGTYVLETAKLSRQEEASGNMQHMKEKATVEAQKSFPSNSSKASDDTKLLPVSEDVQIDLLAHVKDDVGDNDPRMKFGEISYDPHSFSAGSVVFDHEMPNSVLRPDFPSPIPSEWPSTFVRSSDPLRPQLTLNETRQRQLENLKFPSMIAFECGLGDIRHNSFPRGTLVPFQTLKNLGRGSMAHVEEVYIPPYRSFVRKTFLLTMSSDDRLRCRDIIHRETQVMSQLTHKHIVKVIGSYDLEPITSTILMSPVGDNDLKMFLDESLEIPHWTLEWGRRQSWLWKWVGCLTSAIAYIHSQGICHKDIKPSNIVHKGDDIYLTDFSSCGQFDIGGTTSTGADARTTLMYRAPEFFRTGDAGRHGLGTDVFALGLVFLEMKTVYSGTSVQRLRELYAAAANVKSANSYEFYYGKALAHIHEQLKGSIRQSDPEAWPLSSAVILSMLASERKERPSAQQVLDANHHARDCSCVYMMPNAMSDIRSSQPENHEENRSQFSHPSVFADPSMVSSQLPLRWQEYVKPTPLKP